MKIKWDMFTTWFFIGMIMFMILFFKAGLIFVLVSAFMTLIVFASYKVLVFLKKLYRFINKVCDEKEIK